MAIKKNPYREPTKIYKAGVPFKGNDAQWFIFELIQRGYNLIATSKTAGPNTWKAIYAEQTRAGLKPGDAGPKTRAFLKKDIVTPTPAPVVVENPLDKFEHIAPSKREKIYEAIKDITGARKNIILELLNFAFDPAVGGRVRALYVFATNLYDTKKNLFLCSESCVTRQALKYPKYFSNGRKEWMIQQIAQNPTLPSSDCSGMIVGLLRKNGLVANTFDVTANTLNSSSYSTPIKKEELQPGDYVGKDGHIGIYVGGGYVVEFYGGAYGCQLTELDNRRGYDFIRKKMVSGSRWTTYRKPKQY